MAIKALMKAGGELPTVDTDTYDKIVTELIECWDLKKVPELMMVNRMVSTWMKMTRVEAMMAKHDLYFNVKNKDDEIIAVNVNQLAYYLKSLEADFRSYYKILSPEKTQKEEGVQDFQDFLNEKVVDVEKKKKSVRSKKNKN